MVMDSTLAPSAAPAPPLAPPFARWPSALFGGTFASEFDPVGLLQFLYLFGSHFPFRLCQYLAQAASTPIRKSLLPCALNSPLAVARNAFKKWGMLLTRGRVGIELSTARSVRVSLTSFTAWVSELPGLAMVAV